jgi:hypothetical protein
MNNTTVFKYNTSNPQNGIIELDLTNKELLIYENALTRDSNEKPDRRVSFSEVLTNTLLLDEIKVRIDTINYHELVFMIENTFHSSEKIEGLKLFSFQAGKKYPLPNLRILIGIGVGLLLLSLYISSIYILPFIMEGSVSISQKSGVVVATMENIRPLMPILLFCSITFLIGLYLIIFNNKKIPQKGDYYLGTELGLYIFKDKNIFIYNWKDFNGIYRIFNNYSTIIMEYIDPINSTKDTSNPNLIQEIMIIEIPNFESNWKIIKRNIVHE